VCHREGRKFGGVFVRDGTVQGVFIDGSNDADVAAIKANILFKPYPEGQDVVAFVKANGIAF
jgi:hypothetical protein